MITTNHCSWTINYFHDSKYHRFERLLHVLFFWQIRSVSEIDTNFFRDQISSVRYYIYLPTHQLLGFGDYTCKEEKPYKYRVKYHFGDACMCVSILDLWVLTYKWMIKPKLYVNFSNILLETIIKSFEIYVRITGSQIPRINIH